MWEVLLDAFIDSLKVLAVLIIMNILIGFAEGRTSDILTRGKKWTTLIAVSLAILPQCGFSVVATDYYQKRKLTAGTLLGVYIATSDEALPILIANPEKALAILPLMLIKFLVGIAFAFFIDAVFKDKLTYPLIEDKRLNLKAKDNTATVSHTPDLEEACPEEQDHDHHDHKHEEASQLVGCCHHHIEKEKPIKQYLLHPLIHSLKIFAYILAVNIIFGFLIYFVGEDKFIQFMDGNKYLSPLFAVLVGLIPNCASSVVLTDMYVLGGLGFGACVGGLTANAGLGLTFLFKKKEGLKTNLILLALLIGIALIVGYVTSIFVWFII